MTEEEPSRFDDATIAPAQEPRVAGGSTATPHAEASVSAEVPLLRLAVPDSSDWPELEGYQVIGVLGSGGMGIVYRALDLRRGASVAIKTIRHADAGAIYRFKQEFRALLGVSHPNLVALHELISDGRLWFIVMEYVDGSTFLEHVRDRPGEEALEASESGAPAPTAAPSLREALATLTPADYAEAKAAGRTSGSSTHPPVPNARRRGLRPAALTRLREALRQLAEGLQALHQAGKLHRDIKPSNVMVTREGRVVLMDFGLVSSQTRDESLDNNVVGTAAYMAPEQAAGLTLSRASDWYSVGVILFEALTGRRPFVGGALQVMMDKQRAEPTPPSEHVLDVPGDLNALCVELLRREPCGRPHGQDILERLGTPLPALTGTFESSTADPGDASFIGRESERKSLKDALRSVCGGKTFVTAIHGRSGVGKSALVQMFLNGPVAAAGAVVLAGRCYEHESVPYKALDSLIDSLSRYLRHLPGLEADALLPRDIGPLARIFPVLRGVPAISRAPRRAEESPDPQEIRRRACLALRELLGRLGDRHPLVLMIDDLQWGDIDSRAVLAEILRPPEAPALLLVANFRSRGPDDESEVSAFLDGLGAGIETRSLGIAPLSEDESQALARELLENLGGGTDSQAAAIATEARGNPFYLAELARSIKSESPNEVVGQDLNSGIALDEVLWARIVRLPTDARALLEVIAVAGRPIDPGLAWKAIDRDDDERATLSLLRSARLLRGSNTSSLHDGERVETYHDRVRESVVAHLDEVTLKDCHRRLAETMERHGCEDAETLGGHLKAAGQPERAGLFLASAAERAAEALAFDRAASLFREALGLLPSGSHALRLKVSLGDALANAGRGAESAEAYLEAAVGSTAGESLEYRRRAAMQLLMSGHIDRGLDSLADVLENVGLTLPRTPRTSLISLVYRRFLLRLRGVRFTPRDPSEITKAELTRIDVCWSAGVGLSNVDWVRGADFQSRGLLLALRAGEPYRVARALAVEAAQTATAGPKAHQRTMRFLNTAAAFARNSDAPYDHGMITMASGIAAYLETRWADALTHCDQAESIFRDRCSGVAWELDTARAYSLWALSHLGRWGELARRLPLLINEARERGDLYGVMNLSTYILSTVHLAADKPDAAREEPQRVMEKWSHGGYHVQHNDHVWATVQADLYAGDGLAAWDRLSHHWPTLARSLLLQVQFIRVAMLGLRARSALAAAVSTTRDRSLFIRSASKDARRLVRERIPWALAQGLTAHAGVASLSGDERGAIGLLRRAAEQFRSCNMMLCAAAVDRRLGVLIIGSEGQKLVERADAWIAAEAIRNSKGVARMFAPGFR